VFDGTAAAPYRETDATGPKNVYGLTKLAGEEAIEASGAAHLVFRTSWLYSARGRNFVRTVLRLAREKPELAFVDDQVGCPTWARTVADATHEVLKRVAVAGSSVSEQLRPVSGLYHLCATGTTTWYRFALSVLEHDPGRSEHVYQSVRSISTEMFNARADRPRYSVLDTSRLRSAFGLDLTPWDDQLRQMMSQIRSM